MCKAPTQVRMMIHSEGNTGILHTLRMSAGDEAAARAVQILSSGGLVAFPTETVYGLGADATSGEAVARIYEAKDRPSFNPLISHVSTLEDAQLQGVFNDDALKLAQSFWPGPLTLVVPVAPGCQVSELTRAGLKSVALRVPAHPVAQAILSAFGKPVAAPSANRSGRISPTTADHVMQELAGRCELVIDGGATEVGLESTIIACTGSEPVLLRPGGIAREDIERVLGKAIHIAGMDAAVTAPGMLASHYAPETFLRLDAVAIERGEALLDFGGALRKHAAAAKIYLDLSPAGDLRQAAANLFACLRRLDEAGAQAIAVAAIPGHGLGAAINDRLQRAAAPRG